MASIEIEIGEELERFESKAQWINKAHAECTFPAVIYAIS